MCINLTVLESIRTLQAAIMDETQKLKCFTTFVVRVGFGLKLILQLLELTGSDQNTDAGFYDIPAGVVLGKSADCKHTNKLGFLINKTWIQQTQTNDIWRGEGMSELRPQKDRKLLEPFLQIHNVLLQKIHSFHLIQDQNC